MWLHGPEWDKSERTVTYYRKREVHIDSTLAPRQMGEFYGGAITFSGSGKTHKERMDIHYHSEELPQGRFLRHVLDNGFTAVSWWDRNQGDRRGNMNSTILLEGDRTSEEVLAAGRASFPAVFENLAKAGVDLIEVFLP